MSKQNYCQIQSQPTPLLFQKAGSGSVPSSLLTGLTHSFRMQTAPDDTFISDVDPSGLMFVAIGGVTNVVGKIGNGATLNGEATTRLLGTEAVSMLTSNISISFWFKENATQTAFLLGCFDNTDPLASQWCFKFVSGDLIFTQIEDDTDPVNVLIKEHAEDSGDYHHVVLMFNPTSLVLVIFIDDVSIVNGTINQFNILCPAMTVGNDIAITAPAAAQVDELYFWSRILTNEEVDLLWNSGNGITYPFA